MFTEPTVFILGAGASWHYGYPTGEDLVNEIILKCENLWNFYDAAIIKHGIGSGQVSMRYPSLMQTKYISSLLVGRNQEQAYDFFFSQCRDLASRLKQINPLVIDYFLGQNSDLQEIAKIIIAWVLLERETEAGDRLVQGGNNNHNHIRQLRGNPRLSQRDGGKIDVKKCKDDWYRFLIYKLTSNCINPEDLNYNKVKFVTFNYDLSLEANLYGALSAIDLLKKDGLNSVDKFFNPENFLHVYGQLKDDYKKFEPLINAQNGDMPQRSRSYAEILNKCFDASRNINTIDPHEKPKNQDVINKAKKSLSDAKKVYILGYGFDKNNNTLLNLGKCLRPKQHNQKEIYFTNYNNYEIINKNASEVFTGNRSFYFNNSPAVQRVPYGTFERSIKNVYEALEQDFSLV